MNIMTAKIKWFVERALCSVGIVLLGCLCGNAQVSLGAQPRGQSLADHDSMIGQRDELQSGTALARQGKFKEAIPHLLAARGQGQKMFAVQFNLALCYVGTTQYLPAIRILDGLAASNPGNANVFNLLAQAFIGNDQIPEAVNALRKAAALTPKDEKLYLLVADACMEHGLYTVGLDVVNSGLHNLPRSAGLLYQRGMFLALLDQFDSGKLDLELASQIGRGKEIEFLAAAQKATFEGDMREVVRVTREGVKRGFESAALLTMLGDALMREGVSPGQPEFAEAVSAMEKSVALQPDSPASRIALGKLDLMESRIDDAITHLDIARQLDPSNTAVYSNLAKAYRRHGDQAKAQEMLAMLTKLNQKQAEKIRSAPGERKSSYLGSRSEQTQRSSQESPGR